MVTLMTLLFSYHSSPLFVRIYLTFIICSLRKCCIVLYFYGGHRSCSILKLYIFKLLVFSSISSIYVLIMVIEIFVVPLPIKTIMVTNQQSTYKRKKKGWFVRFVFPSLWAQGKAWRKVKFLKKKQWSIISYKTFFTIEHHKITPVMIFSLFSRFSLMQFWFLTYVNRW